MSPPPSFVSTAGILLDFRPRGKKKRFAEKKEDRSP
jgi:hypothetical protein